MLFRSKKRVIIIFVFIGVVLVCVGSYLFANGGLFQGENKQMDSANIDEPMWEEQDLSRKGVTGLGAAPYTFLICLCVQP